MLVENAIDVVECPTLGVYASAWDALVNSSHLPSPFLRSWWLEGVAGHRPIFLLVVASGRLLGGLALEDDCRAGVRRLRFLGNGALAPDHLDLVAAPGHEQVVVQALASWFQAHRSLLIDLRGVAERAMVEAALPRPVRRCVISSAPYTALPENVATYLAERPSRLRNTVERVGKRLAKAGLEHRVVDSEDADRALEDLWALHLARFGKGSGFTPAFSAFSRAARRGIEKGEVFIHELRSKDEVVASLVMLDVAGRSSFYQSGRSLDPRWRGSGTVLMAQAVECAGRRGSREFDLLRGDEPYKWEWATQSREVVHLMTSRGSAGRFVMIIMLTGIHSRNLLARLVRRSRLAKHIKGRAERQ